MPPGAAVREPTLDKTKEEDIGVARSHLADLQFRFTAGTIDPLDRNHRVGMTAHDALQRHLNGKIELASSQRRDGVDYRSAIELEGVREIVVGDREDET